MDVQPQETITADSITIRYRVIDPAKAINRVEDNHQAGYLAAQTTLRIREIVDEITPP